MAELNDCGTWPPSFSKKAVAFGEIHGISNLVQPQIEIIRDWLVKGHSVSVCLERAFNQQELIEDWLSTGRPGADLSDGFLDPKTSHHLDNQLFFLSKASLLRKQFPGKMHVLCVDIAFENAEDEASREILKIKDEDEFDKRREDFILARMQDHGHVLHGSDKIIWIAGNMHASKTARYFPLNGGSSSHIPTAAMWLDEQYGLESVFTLPFSGALNYQSGGRLIRSEIEVTSPEFSGLMAAPFDGFRPSVHFQNLSADFKNSYDWIFGIKRASPSGTVRPQIL